MDAEPGRNEMPTGLVVSDTLLRVLHGARTSAAAMGNSYIGSEHLLLALFDESDANATRILGDIGVDAESIRRSIAADAAEPSEIGNTEPILPFTVAAEGVLVSTAEQARARGSEVAGTEHLLLAMLHSADLGGVYLRDSGITPERVVGGGSRGDWRA